NWQPLQSGLPHAPVYWMTVQERFHDLALATYGRGFWILDDISPLQQMTPEVRASDAHLFAPRDAYRFRNVTEPASVTYDPTAGHNPPFGAVINYYLKSATKDAVKIEIADASGKTVRTFDGTTSAGVNRVWWDMRFDPGKQFRLRTSPLYAPEVTVGPEGWRPAPGVEPAGPLATPGTYTVKLLAGGKEYTQKLRILKDPHSTGTDADIQTQTKLVEHLQNELNAMADTVNQLESVRAQLNQLGTQLGDDANSKSIRDAANELNNKLTDFEGHLLQLKATGRGQDDVRWESMLVEKLAYLARQLGSTDFPPTTQQVAVADELSKKTEQYRNEGQQLMSNDVAAFNSMLRQRNVANIIVKTP
ncbi:MAG: sialidase, partial [Candidatus Acidiferrales bacterium]